MVVSFDLLSSSTPHKDHHHHQPPAAEGVDGDVANHISPKTFRVTPHPNKWLDVRGEADEDDDDVLRLLRTGHDTGNDKAYHQRDLQQGQREPMLDSCVTNVQSVCNITEPVSIGLLLLLLLLLLLPVDVVTGQEQNMSTGTHKRCPLVSQK